MAQAKAPADKPQAMPAYPASTSRSSAGTLSPEPGTYGSGSACPATLAGTAFPAASLIAATTVSATTVSATTGGCPTVGAPAPRAHPSRDGNLRRALTTPHLHPPSRRRTE